MIYATVRDMVLRYGEDEIIQLSDTATPPIAVDEVRVNTALADASSLVDSYLCKRYALPLGGCADPDGGAEPVPPPVLTRIVCDLARYGLHNDITETHDAYKRRGHVIRLLDAIASGAVSLGCPLGDSPGTELSGGDGEVQYGFAPRHVTDATLQGYP